jgi:hypothetical protein
MNISKVIRESQKRGEITKNEETMSRKEQGVRNGETKKAKTRELKRG